MKSKLIGMAAVVIGAVSADAALVAGNTILVDYTGDPGGTVNPTANITFNNIVDAIDTTGANTGVNITLSGFAFSANNGNTQATAPTSPFSAVSLLGWIGAVDDGVTQLITFSGLDNGLTYDIALASGTSNASFVNFEVQFTADGQTSAVIDSRPAADSWAGLSGLSTDGAGNLVVEVTSGATAGADNIVNAIQITAVPEPSSVLLFGLGGFTLILRRRK